LLMSKYTLRGSDPPADGTGVLVRVR
jgi:hypothetical protein